MKSFLLALSILTAPSLWASPNDGFIYSEEDNVVEHKTLGNVEVVVLEDFLEHSLIGAQVVAVEENALLVKRDERLAVLVTRDQYEKLGNGVFIQFNQCTSQCGGLGIAGALAGGLAGASQGAETGAAVTLTPQGAAGGALIGAVVGGVAGGITAYETCRIVTKCGDVAPAEDPKRPEL